MRVPGFGTVPSSSLPRYASSSKSCDVTLDGQDAMRAGTPDWFTSLSETRSLPPPESDSFSSPSTIARA